MKLRKYKLIDTHTNTVVKTVNLTYEEMVILNYAYALNLSPLKYLI